MTARRDRVLVVEDDASVREVASVLLRREGFDVECVVDGREALDALERSVFDLVLLDVMLPSLSGFDVCRRIRLTSQVPVVMLTARDDVTDIVAGLELGADDYITKPFDGAELVARVRAVLRRRSAGGDGEQGTLRVGDVEVDIGAFRAEVGGRALDLTATEFRLLAELASHPGQVASRERLLEEVWGYDYLGDSRLVDMAVKRLRDKLGDDPRRPRYISTVRGVGYRFERE